MVTTSLTPLAHPSHRRLPMHNLPTQAHNLTDCLYIKVRSDNPQLKRPTIDVEFDIIENANRSGNMTSHLIARDRRTKSYIYLAEEDAHTGEWGAMDSEFHDRIYLFIEHVLRLIDWKAAKATPERAGQIIKELATSEFQKLMRS